MKGILFSKLFHQASKDLSLGHSPIPAKAEDYPNEWKKVYYKKYKRFDSLKLPEPPDVSVLDLFTSIKRRSSKRNFNQEPISLVNLSTLLKYSFGIFDGKNVFHRVYPSAGARYPLEVYPIIFCGVDIKSGVYHYDVSTHSLESLFTDEKSLKKIKESFGDKWVSTASFVLIISAVFNRNQMKYGERGYRHVLFETGHAGQLVLNLSEELGLRSSISLFTNDNQLEKIIGLDGVTESVVYTIFFG